MKSLLFFLSIFLCISCSSYKIAERHLDRKMEKSDLAKSLWVNDHNNDTIEYWDNAHSSKPPLVLIHGFGASTKYQFSKQVKDLSEDYRLILPNLYYFGKTCPGSKKSSIEDQIDLVNSLLNHLSVDTFSLVGVSYGGLISIELAQERKEDIQKLILFDTPVKYMSESDIDSVKNYFEVPSIEELFVPENPKGLKKLLFLATGKKSIIPAFMLKQFHREAYVKTMSEKRSLLTDMISRLKYYQNRTYQLDRPVLLLWGENDMIVPANRGKLLQDHIGDQCEYHLIENAAHMPNMTEAKEFNQIICEFLNR